MLAIGLAFGATPSMATQSQNADAVAATQLLADATIDYSHGEHHFYEYYGVDGLSRAADEAGEHRMAGRWRVREDGTVCFLHADPNQSGCVFLRVDGEHIEFHRIDGLIEGPFRLLRGNPRRL